MSKRTILVTGATGKVGGQVVNQLAGSGHRVRALSRDPATAPPALAASGAEGVAGAPGRPEDLELDGVDTVFLVFPSVVDDANAGALVRRLAASVQRVVYLSAHGVPDEPLADPGEPDGTIVGSHTHVESLLARSGLEWTFLRPGGFASNTLGWADQIRRGDVVRWFVPGAVRSLVHEADLAAVGVRALTEDGWHGARPHLTGPEQLSQLQQLDRLGAALGRVLHFSEIDAGAVHRELFPGAPQSFVDAIVEGHRQFVTHPEPVTGEVARLTGRAALTYAQWARDHVADFR